MADDPNFSEPPLTARERALQEKIIRLEKRLEGYQSQIDIIDSQRHQLEERAISMESALAKAKKGLLEAKKELMDREIAEREMAEKLKCMTQQAEEYKNLLVAERNKTKYSIETLETLLSTVEAEMALRKEFQGFLNEILTEVKKGFYAQLKVVFDKLTAGPENKLRGSPQEMNHSKTLLTTSSSETQLRMFRTTGTTSATSSSSTQHGMFPRSSSSTQYGMFQTAATTTVTSSSPTQYGMFCTAATTTVTSSAPTQQGMFDTSKKSFDPMAKSPPKSSWTCRVCLISNEDRTTVCVACDASKEQETSANSTSQKCSDLMAKFAPKPGSWSCSVCLVTNKQRTTVCVACGAAKLSGGTPSALEASKTSFHLFNQTTNSSASNTVFRGFQGNASSGSACAFGKSDGVSVNTSPFKFGINDSGPKNKSLFTFGSNNSGPVNSSPFTFATSNAGTTAFVKSDEGTVNSSPFTFGTTDTTRNVGCSQITFGAPPSARDDTSSSEKAAVSASQMVGGPTELPPTSNPPTSKPFLLAAFRVPAFATKTSTSSFAFGSLGLTGSSPLSVSMPEKAVAEENASVFGSSTPDQGSAAFSFGSFKTGTSPSFDLDLSTHSASRTQPDPLLSEKYRDVNQVAPDVSQKARVIQNQSQPSFSFGTSTGQNMPEEKLFWQQPTGTFQFGQLDAYAPLGGATSWTAGNNPWRQATQPSSKSETSHIQSALQTSEMFSQPFTLSDFAGSELLRRLAVAKEQHDSANQESLAGGYKFTPYVVYEPAEEASLQRVTNPISTVIVEECDDYDDEAVIEESEDTTDENLSYSSTEGEEDDGENEDSVEFSSPMPPIQSSQTQPPFSPSQGKPLTTPLKPVPIHSTLVENAGPANLPPHLTGRCYLTPESALKATKKQDEDCLLVYEVRASMANREKASRLFLPSNFFNYTKQELCPGCLGCLRIAKESKGQKPQHKSPGYTGAGAQLFAAEITENDDGTAKADNDGPHFEPKIPLPDKIDVETGEEDEVMFSRRAKLYRFLADDKQWKERGVGDIKLLRNRQSGKMRVLMRRDQGLNICANHQITTDMKLQPNAGSDRSWVWSTSADFSEQERKAEQLAVRFKSEDIAKQFKEKFEECQELLKNQTPVKTPQRERGEEEVKEGLLTRFKATERSWECDICMLRNDSDKFECAACGGLKPGAEPSQDQKKDTKTSLFESTGQSSGSVFSFASATSYTGGGFSFGSAGTSQIDPRFLSFGAFGETQNSKSGTPIRFGFFQQEERVTKQLTEDNRESDSPTVEETPHKEVEDEKDEQAQNVQDTYSTTDNAQAEDSNKEETKPIEESGKESPSDEQAANDPSQNTEETFLFGSSSISSLSFQSVAATSLTGSPFGQKTSASSSGFAGAGSLLFATKTTGDHDVSVTEDDHDGPHFEPIIPLPDKIDVKTGEEDEEVMFSHRAKLYRFLADDKQWKERGVGDIKLLRNRQSGKMRVLMRRDQGLNICANHQITTDMKLQPNAGSDRSLVWSTSADFSEQECKAEQLVVRFKSEDIAKQFKEKFEECQELLKNQTPVKTPQRERGEEEVKEGLLTRFKATEGSWECDICMLRNDSDKFECAACGGLKPGAEPSQDQKKDTKTSLFGSTGQSSGSVFSFASGTSYTGGGFSFGSAGTSQIGPRFLSFGAFGETQNSKSGTPIRFGFFQQEERVTKQLTEDNRESDSPTVEETPHKEVEDEKDEQAQNVQDTYSTTDKAQAEDSNKEETKPIEESGRESPSDEQAAKDPSQNAEETFLFGSSSISSCSFQSVAGTSLTSSPFGQKASTSSPGFAGPSSLVFAANATGDHDESAPNSGVPVTFNSFGQGGNASEPRVRGKKVSFNQTPSYGAAMSFGLPKSSQSDTKPTYSFGSISQTPNLSSGVPVSFGSFGQGGNASEQTVETQKVSFNQTPSHGEGFSFGSAKTSRSDTKPTYSFGSISQTPNLSSGVPVSFGSFGQGGNVTEQKVEKKVPFGSAFTSTEVGPFSSAMQSAERGYCFRSTTSTAGAGFSFAPTTSTAGAFGSTTYTAGTGVFGSTTSTAGAGVFGSTTSTAGAGVFGSTTSTAGAGGFGSTTSTVGAGGLFGRTTSSAGAGGLFGRTTSSAGAGGLLGRTTSSAGAGGLFVSTSSEQSTHPMFSFGLTMPSTTSS